MIGRVGRPGDRKQIPIDVLCVGFGFRPNTELVRLLGCDCRVEAATGDVLPLVDRFGATSVSGVFVAGEAMRIAGVHSALVGGRVAAHGMLVALGLRPTEAIPDDLLRRAARLGEFANIAARAFAPAVALYGAIPDNAIVCRCESVTAATIRAAVRLGWNDLNSVKGVTRAGMGPCQGRLCGPSVANLVASAFQSTDLDDACPRLDAFTPRMPVRPLLYPRFPDQ